MADLLSLRHSLQALAQSADFQKQLLAGWLDPPAELPERAHQAVVHLQVTGHTLTTEQEAALAALFAKFASFSGPENAEHWSDDALESSHHWAEVRHLATPTLHSFGWSHETPPLERSAYGEEFFEP